MTDLERLLCLVICKLLATCYPVQFSISAGYLAVCLEFLGASMRKHPPGMSRKDDSDLLAACLRGEQVAWDELVARYSRLVFSIALKSGLSDTDANDVLQNVFISVLRRLESLRDPERFSSWLITTTRRESWRYKKAQREQVLDDGIDVVDSESDTEAEIVAWESVLLTHRGLQLLGDRCRRLITMIFLTDDRPGYEEISSELGIAIGSIGPIRARCLKQLRDHLQDLGLEYES